jgi:hypothetical protein
MKKSIIQSITIIPFVFLLCNTFCWLMQGEEVAKPSFEQTKIAFHSNRDGNAEIYVMNADGSEQTNLTNNPAHDMFPSWSPFFKTVK